MVDQNGGKFERFQNLKKCILSKLIFPFLQNFIEWYKESDEKTKKIDVTGTLSHLLSINTRAVLKLSIPCSIKWLSPGSTQPRFHSSKERGREGDQGLDYSGTGQGENILCLCFKTSLPAKPLIMWNEFDLPENEPVFGTYFHMNGFVGKTHFDTEAKGNSKMAYYNSLRTLEITPNFLLSVSSERRWGPTRVKKIDLDATLTGRQSLCNYSIGMGISRLSIATLKYEGEECCDRLAGAYTVYM